jgi:hypothetical protein
MEWYELDSSGSGEGPVEGSCDHDNEPSKKKKTPWSESASELHRPSDHRLSVK